ncbi:DUF3793 family protein [Anaerocolumna aminovalerica]|jgi:hypothetical protein|uniref:DUF3793 family protein n=1 Tax=Anaerocolumna aminovalerica TaxID=1527 RepID=A0A1I5FEG3_9FIRM|nr:DUF3793 family protein [Anaerocolumna aminovalerica]MBU5333865.1 DUF3793 family protein [Anaerocolumna aminovalerica]MDU6263990.1 DUF3793 family protein [Anaerocolumna aminovalerica]SFO22112.1 Protein of unknown function [Anaerocolumna aminovalerica]
MGKENLQYYIHSTLANNCIPVLMKIKTAGFINFKKAYITDRQIFMWLLKEELEIFHCQYEFIYEDEKYIYVFIYNSEPLKAVIGELCDHPILLNNGYSSVEPTIDNYIKIFKHRYMDYAIHKVTFPHELGIFLGYPIHDVEGYINNNGENYLLNGYWKVYDKAADAVKIFQNYQCYRNKAVELILSGKGLSEILI